MISEYLFLLLKLLHAIAKFYQINWRIKRRKTCGSIVFVEIRYHKVELLIGNSAITEFNQLKDIYIIVFIFTF